MNSLTRLKKEFNRMDENNQKAVSRRGPVAAAVFYLISILLLPI